MIKTIESLKRTPYQSLGIFFTLSFSLFVLIIFSFSIILVTKVVNYIETQPQVTIYFSKATPESNIFKLRETLLKTSKVKEARYINKDEALKIYKELNKNEPLLVEMVSKEALPASLEVYTYKPEYLKEIADQTKTEPGVESVAFQQDIIDNLIKITNSIKITALIFLSAQFAIVFFVIFTTLTFKILSKKDEIEIQRLLGASRYFVTKPLLKENFLINFFSTASGGSVFGALYLGFNKQLSGFLLGIPTLTLFNSPIGPVNVWPINIPFFILIAGFSFLLGYVLIWITTFIAASKYVK